MSSNSRYVEARSTAARNFGSADTEARIAARHTAMYGENPGQAILDAQRAHTAAQRELAERVAEKTAYAAREQAQEDAAYRGKMARDEALQAQAPRTGNATPKAIQFLVDLAAERTPQVPEANIRAWADEQPWQAVSAKIDELKKQPRAARPQDTTRAAAPAVDVPEGRYAVTGEEGQTVFVRVDRPTEGRWAGYTFVKIQASDELHRVSRATSAALLAKIAAAGVQAASQRYGQEIGKCGRCGRTLTDKTSRDFGIGPDCRAKLGW